MHQPSIYAPAFAGHPRFEIACVADDPGQIDDYIISANQGVASEYGVPYLEDIGQVSDDPTIDVCSVCAQLERRGEISRQMAAAGKHLFMDKPHAVSVSEAKDIAEAVRTTGVTAVIYGRQLSATPSVIRSQVELGAVGKLIAIHWDLIFAKGQAGTVPDGWETCISTDLETFTFRSPGLDPSGSGHNVWAKRELHEIGLYPVGLVQDLVGVPVRSVYARLGQYWLATHAERGVEDFALMQMGFENGVTATITTGRYGRQTDPAGGVDKVLVVGTEGSIVADGSPPNAAVYATAGSDGKSATRVNGSDASGVTTLLDELAWAIDRGHHPPNNVDHGVAQIETLLAGYKSYFTGEVVTLPLE